MTTVQIPLGDDEKAMLEEQARKQNRPLADLLAEAVSDYVQDIRDARIATQREAHPGKTWSLEELEAGRDLEN